MAKQSEGDGRQGTLAGLWLEPTRKRPSQRPASSEVLTTPFESRTTNLEARTEHPFAPWSVRDLVNDLRQHVEAAYVDLWVEGEISNCRTAPSGHVYFTLKDGEAQLPVVLFRRQAQLLGFQPQDGLAVLVRGRVSVYESRGQLQLIAETLQLRGAGALQLAYEQLKARLLAEGLFDTGRKRPLPAFPRTVGVITSMGGAVLHDIIKVVRRRHARLNLLVYPATVQGPDCAVSVAAGIRWFNQSPKQSKRKKSEQDKLGQVDLILIARGGGSLEDLAGFNDEALARAIAASMLPVVSAIGHETDFTIADFVADMRAPTPSAAAELITAAQHGIEERIAALDARVRRAIRYQMMLARQCFTALSVNQMQNRVQGIIGRRGQRLDDLRHRLALIAHRRLRERSSQLAGLAARLERCNPAIRLALARRRMEVASQSLGRLALTALAAHTTRLDRASARLDALSPLAVLNRGYALIYIEEGKDAGQLLRNASDAHPGQAIRARLANGSVTAEVKSTESA
jgi:exodeoxyribonuclease VII large subunit